VFSQNLRSAVADAIGNLDRTYNGNQRRMGDRIHRCECSLPLQAGQSSHQRLRVARHRPIPLIPLRCPLRGPRRSNLCSQESVVAV